MPLTAVRSRHLVDFLRGWGDLLGFRIKARRFVEGWEVRPILTANTGLPVNVYNGLNPQQSNTGGLTGDRPDYSGAAGCHPYQILDVVNIAQSTHLRELKLQKGEVVPLEIEICLRELISEPARNCDSSSRVQTCKNIQR